MLRGDLGRSRSLQGINDIHGHAIGDQILRVVAEKLKFEMAANTLISRLGGDEFVVLCEDVNDALEAP